jgi:hypothetical protein
MFKYNQAAKGAPKVGGGKGGDSFPPCKVVVAFRKAKADTSKEPATLNKPMVITEWEVLQVVRQDYPSEEGYKNWKGDVLTVKEGVKRSYVIWPAQDGSWGELNELAALLNGVNTRNPAAMRAAGLVAKDESAAEVDRLANVFNGLIERVLSEDGTNPMLDYVLELETAPKVTRSNRTFMRHSFSFPSDAEALAHNAAILAKLGLKIAA